jgi:pimeloyl-ACP methyl ester carboxylesterase
MDKDTYSNETVWTLLSRLCRLMCGGGSAPPKAVPNQSGAMPPTWGVAPDSISSCRKGEALPHIGRRSRKLRPACIALFLLICYGVSAQNKESRIRNIVLVHGAWADGSGWKGVYDILLKDGYKVSIVQEPETSFKEDVAATKRVLAQQDGSCILVAHSYGGAVITEAGMDPSVVGLVYVAAHMPDAGESEADVGKRFPSDLSKSTEIKTTADGFTYLDPAQFHEYFAADLSAEQAAFMARSQVLNATDNFKAVITTAAWRSKPSWVLVAAKDRTINPDLERWYATRANSQKVEVPGASHAVYISRPKEVAAVIEDAAFHARR